MSYKHNNLMAMRINYWSNSDSEYVKEEKVFFQQILEDHQIFSSPTSDDAKYLFFSLPSIIIVKGYASGFKHQHVKNMIDQFIQSNKALLSRRNEIKIRFRN